MIIQTKDFGELTIDSSEILHFKQPIYGFEDFKNYVVLFDDSVGNWFSWLQSIDNSDVCFILVDPSIISDYHPIISSEIQKSLEISNEDDIAVRVVAVIAEDFEKSTINLKSPIIIGKKSRIASQVILDDDFPIKSFLIGGGK